jgi:hypothetical protein
MHSIIAIVQLLCLAVVFGLSSIVFRKNEKGILARKAKARA